MSITSRLLALVGCLLLASHADAGPVCDPPFLGSFAAAPSPPQPGYPESVHDLCVVPSGGFASTDYWQQRVHLFSPRGDRIRSWSVPGIPMGISADPSGHVYVLSLGATVYRFRLDGTIDAAWRPPLPDFVRGAGVATAPDGTVYAAYYPSSVVHYTNSGSVLDVISTGLSLNGIAVSSGGDLFVSDWSGDQVCMYSPAGARVTCWGSSGGGPNQLQDPRGMAVTPDGYLLIADQYNHRIAVCLSAGPILCTWGHEGSGPGEFEFPGGVVVGPDGAIYVADSNNVRIVKFGDAPTQARRTSWGQLKAAYR